MNQPAARPRWSSQTRLLVTIFLILAAGYMLYKFSVAIGPLVLAIILAFILTPLVNILHNRLRFPRWLAMIAAYLVFTLFIAGILWILIPTFVNQASRFTVNLELMLRDAGRFFDESIIIAGISIDGQVLLQQAITALEGAVQPVLGSTLNFVTVVLSSLVWVVFIVVISIYLVKDHSKIREYFFNLIPPAYQPDFERLRFEISAIWGSFFRGQLLLALVVSVIITIECLIIGMPFPLVMGLIAGLMEFFPSVGHGVWLVLALLLGVFAGSTWLPLPPWAFAILILVLHIIFTQFDLNYLIPRIIGRSVHLPPLVVILGIVAGAALAGVLGVVLAAPTIASLRVVLRYVYANLFDLEPFPHETLVQPLPPPDPLWWQKRVPRTRR